MIIQAKFKGEDSLGYKKGTTYKLKIDEFQGVSVKRLDGTLVHLGVNFKGTGITLLMLNKNRMNRKEKRVNTNKGVSAKPSHQRIRKFDKFQSEIREKLTKSNISAICYMGIEGGQFSGGITGDLFNTNNQ